MTPEVKERVWETVNEMIDCCDGDEFHSEGCTRIEEVPWYEDDGDQDFLFEIARDKRYFDD